MIDDGSFTLSTDNGLLFTTAQIRAESPQTFIVQLFSMLKQQRAQNITDGTDLLFPGPSHMACCRKIHFKPRSQFSRSRNCRNLSSSKSLRALLRSFSAPTKLLPRSSLYCRNGPRIAMKRRRQLMNESVSMVLTVST